MQYKNYHVEVSNIQINDIHDFALKIIKVNKKIKTTIYYISLPSKKKKKLRSDRRKAGTMYKNILDLVLSTQEWLLQ